MVSNQYYRKRKFKTMGKNSGFSLIELMVVMGIFALLTAFAIPNYLKWLISKTKTAEITSQNTALIPPRISYF